MCSRWGEAVSRGQPRSLLLRGQRGLMDTSATDSSPCALALGSHDWIVTIPFVLSFAAKLSCIMSYYYASCTLTARVATYFFRRLCTHRLLLFIFTFTFVFETKLPKANCFFGRDVVKYQYRIWVKRLKSNESITKRMGNRKKIEEIICYGQK